ncbi:hypothetical protein ACFVSS_04885 [Peribacillus butanolivorans]|uniref:hypothetical protein n=1 Tax=Peribacillus butanolivorans TaxID=421767 RepID=UPI0036DC4D05
MFTESVGRLLKPRGNITDIVAYPDEKRIAFLEYMKEMSNKQRQLKLVELSSWRRFLYE